MAPPHASQPKKEPKDMRMKELLAHCNTLLRKVAKKQTTIAELRKKKGATKEDCAECKVKDQLNKDLLDTAKDAKLEDKKIRDGLVVEHEAKNSKLTEKNNELQNECRELQKQLEIAKIKMDAKVEELENVKGRCEFYIGRLFPDRTPPDAAHHAASVSMMGGGGYRGQSLPINTPSPDAP